MKPTFFTGFDKVLGAPTGWDASQGECEGLPVMVRDGVCISYWEPTPEERERIAKGGYIVAHVVSGRTQFPMALTVEDEK
jgi:hypothetical protein